jgi:hypothetical protein
MTDKQQDPMPALAQEKAAALAARLRLVCRCGARTRAGGSCRQPAMANGRCRMHGGLSTGPRTQEGLQRLALARTVHGAYGREMRAFREAMAELREDAKQLRVEVVK